MERIDDLNFNGLKIIQDDQGFCFGCDAVELANFASVKRIDKVCDLGSNSGIISLLIAAKQGAHVTAVEIQSAAAELCRRNVALNGLEGKIDVLNIPMQDLIKPSFSGCFNAVICNPPYRKKGSGEIQPQTAVALARHEIAVNFAEVAQTAAYILSFGGKFWFIHQAQRMAECIAECVKNRLEPKILQMLVPAESKPPHLFMACCVKDGKSGVNVLSERIVNTIV